MTDREQLRALVDTLPDDELRPALRFLEFLRNQGAPPALRALALAPMDDEPMTDEDRAALEEARADVAAGRVVSHAEARRRLLGT
jgi:hypothetical protein